MKSSEKFFFPHTCYEPGKTEDVKNCHTGCGQDVDRSIIKGAAGVGQSQWEDAVCPQHYQVNGDVGLYGATCQVRGPCDAIEQPYKIIINHRRNAKGVVFTKAVKLVNPPSPMAAIITIHQIMFTTTAKTKKEEKEGKGLV